MDSCFCWPCCPKPVMPVASTVVPVHGSAGASHAAGVAKATRMDAARQRLAESAAAHGAAQPAGRLSVSVVKGGAAMQREDTPPPNDLARAAALASIAVRTVHFTPPRMHNTPSSPAPATMPPHLDLAAPITATPAQLEALGIPLTPHPKKAAMPTGGQTHRYHHAHAPSMDSQAAAKYDLATHRGQDDV